MDATSPSTIIKNQKSDEFRSRKYGLFPMSFNGCEIIAVYNALVLSGKVVSLDELIHTFKKQHLMLLLGLFGSWVYGTRKILTCYGIRSKKIVLQEIQSDGIYIVSFWNPHPPFGGIHTVATEIRGGTSITYNLYSNQGVSTTSPHEYAGKRFITACKLT